MDIQKLLWDILTLGAGSWFGLGEPQGLNTLLPNLLKALS